MDRAEFDRLMDGICKQTEREYTPADMTVGFGAWTTSVVDDEMVMTPHKIEEMMVAIGDPLPEVVVTASALVETEERTFPVSKHRSKRIHKKLVKRFGGEFRKKPGCFQVGGQFYVHPAIYGKLSTVPARPRQEYALGLGPRFIRWSQQDDPSSWALSPVGSVLLGPNDLGP